MPAEPSSNGAGGIRPARPRVVVDGRELAALTEGLVELRVQESIAGLFNCEATFGNWGATGGGTGFLHFDRRTLDFGKPLRVDVGSQTIFDGRITALEGRFPEGSPPTLVALAEDRLQDLRMTRRTRTFFDLTDSDLFARLAGDHGLTPQIDVNGPKHRVLAQLDQSDLAFMRERARAVGAELSVQDRTLRAQHRSERGAAPVRLAHGRSLRELRVIADLADQQTKIKVCGWDVAAKEALSESADDSALAGELDGRESGAAVLSAAIAGRSEHVVATVPVSSQEARARAETLFRARARRFVRGWGLADTEPGLRAGARVRLEGVGPLFAGDFHVCEVIHRFDGERGIRTEFAVERPGLGRAA